MKSWGYMDIWHLINFTFFQIAVLSLFFLAKRIVNPWSALFTSLLFCTQPLLFGHAFINPKDVPFLTLFMLSGVLGFAMVDALERTPKQRATQIKEPFPSFGLILAILFGGLIFTYVGKDLIFTVVDHVISKMYTSPADSAFGRFFSLLVGSSNRLPVENYIHKASAAHLERIALYFLALLALGRKFYLNRLVYGKWFILPQINLRLVVLVLFASITLGLTNSIRLIAPFAGLLIVGYALWVKGRAVIPILVLYASVAMLVSVLTWPFLWESPAYNFIEAFKVMRDFPYNAELRFMGDNIAPSNLPWYFIPFLMTVQLTEPAILLAWIGLAFAVYKHKALVGKETLLLGVWLAVPLGLQILFRSNVYDNFRQFLFVLPPVFVFAGMGFEELASRLKGWFGKGLVIFVSLLPGLIGLISLHPIQYIYYNSFIGGVKGADGYFELDYWLTAYREAAPYINSNASPNANILAWGSGFNGARNDLDVYGFVSEDDVLKSDLVFEYAVITTRFSSHLEIFEEKPVVFEVRRNGALLAVVKKLAD